MASSNSTSIGEVFDSIVARLTAAAVDAPTLDAKWLLGQILEIDPSEVLSRRDREIPAGNLPRIDDLVEKRVRGVPLAYLLGEWEFWSLPLFVTPAVLVPRPETELLVEWGSALLRDLPGPRIAEVGTGSGCIAIALATELPAATIDAVDISSAALQVAVRNVDRHRVEDRISLFEGDLLAPLTDRGPYSLIVSNPPYVAVGDPRLEENVAAHEPALALYDVDAGDGLGFYRRLLDASVPLLTPDGVLLLELPEDGASPVAAMAVERGFTVEVRNDLAGVERVICCSR